MPQGLHANRPKTPTAQRLPMLNSRLGSQIGHRPNYREQPAQQSADERTTGGHFLHGDASAVPIEERRTAARRSVAAISRSASEADCSRFAVHTSRASVDLPAFPSSPSRQRVGLDTPRADVADCNLLRPRPALSKSTPPRPAGSPARRLSLGAEEQGSVLTEQIARVLCWQRLADGSLQRQPTPLPPLQIVWS